MPTKFLVVETSSFQLGANAGETTERVDIAAFPARLKKHLDAAKAGSPDLLFVLAPADLRMQSAYADATSGAAPVSVALFATANDAIRFLPSILIFADGERAGGAKECLQKGTTIYNESFFNAKAVGTKLDPCFVFARERLDAAGAANAWACLQSLVFLGLQSLPEVGEKGTGEKVDVQLGADDKFLAFTVRFDLAADKLPFLRANPILSLPRFSAGVFETRYVAAGRKVELSCLFFRGPGVERTIEINGYHPDSALESGADVKSYEFKTFGSLTGDAPAAKPAAKGGFKKKFSEQVRVVTGAPETEESTTVSGGGAPEKPQTVVVSGSAGLGAQKDAAVAAGKTAIVVERETVFKNEGAANRVIELEAKVRSLEETLKTREDLLSKATKQLNDPMAKRDVITNIKDSQSEGLKTTVKNLEAELEEAKGREKELMKMVDKAVQMKDEAAKKIKELDLKLKQASSGGGSKVQMLEKALEEQKRQNKELSKRISEMNEKLRAA